MNSIVSSTIPSHIPLTFTKATRAHQEHPECNEDFALFDLRSRLAVICDGVGYAIGADQAARAAARATREHWRHLLSLLEEQPLKQATDQADAHLEPILCQLLERANEAVLGERKRLTKSNKDAEEGAYAETTIALAFLLPQNQSYLMGYAHVGDSRIYVLREKETLQRLTVDDGYFEWKIHKGEMNAQEAWHIEQASSTEQLTEKELEHFNQRNKISQSLGDNNITMHVGQTTINAGDRVLLCTDGIHDNLTDAEIETILRKSARTTAAKALLKETIERSQQDTKVCLRAKKDDMSAIVITCPPLPRTL